MRFHAVSGAAVIALCVTTTAASAQTLSTERALWEMTEVTATPAVQHLYPVKSYGPSGSPSSNGNGSNGNGSSADKPEFGDSEQGSLGCIVGGTFGTVGAFLIGGENIINLIAGGLVPAASPVALYAAMGGVVFASFCAVGQAMTPIAVYTYRRYFGDTEPAAPGVPMVNKPPATNSSTISPSRFLKIAEPR